MQQRSYYAERERELNGLLYAACQAVQIASQSYAIAPRAETYSRVSECLASADAIRMELLGVRVALADHDRVELTDVGAAVLTDHRLAS